MHRELNITHLGRRFMPKASSPKCSRVNHGVIFSAVEIDEVYIGGNKSAPGKHFPADNSNVSRELHDNQDCAWNRG